MQDASSSFSSPESFVDQAQNYLRNLVAKGGPIESDYAEYRYWLDDIHKRHSSGQLSAEALNRIRQGFGETLGPETIHGFGLLKPHGYSGDFEMMERIYQYYISPNDRSANWDRFFHVQAAPRAVRNRKAYFHGLLDRLVSQHDSLRVLNIGCGPARCIFEWLERNPSADVFFDCIDYDADAVEYAARLNSKHNNRVRFTRANVLRYRPSEKYQLIWGSGVFDYFNDRVFTRICDRLIPAIADGGELVIGNFSPKNPDIAYMKITGEWELCNRTEDQLISLLQQCGIPRDRLFVDQEPEGVVLFVHALFGAVVN